jgi:hypothetical protein
MYTDCLKYAQSKATACGNTKSKVNTTNNGDYRECRIAFLKSKIEHRAANSQELTYMISCIGSKTPVNDTRAVGVKYHNVAYITSQYTMTGMRRYATHCS